MDTLTLYDFLCVFVHNLNHYYYLLCATLFFSYVASSFCQQPHQPPNIRDIRLNAPYPDTPLSLDDAFCLICKVTQCARDKVIRLS